ncbi:MAG: hypothetical protein ACRCYC_09250 [Paraclostridium sp.]|uniref:hypothetical protein n=1 Tax=Paraclostridium sp. TaxID=2023273 RepID=UPI003F36832E
MNNNKWGKLFYYFSIFISILTIYFSIKNVIIIQNSNTASLISTIAYITANICNIYNAIKSKNNGKDIILNTYRIKGSSLMLISVLAYYLISRISLLVI